MFNGTTPDRIAAKQDSGTDVIFSIDGDDIASGTDTYGSLNQGALSSTAAVLFTPTSAHQYLVDNIKLTNPGASQRTVTLYRTKNSTTYDATTVWGSTIILNAGESAEWNGTGWVTSDSTGKPTVALADGPSKVVHIFQGTTTYTPSAGVRALYVEMVGGGGGGGGVLDAATNGAGAGGGGAGAYSAVYTTTIKASFACVVGAKGTGGASGANNGNPGTDSTFDSASICTADGGAGGISQTVSAALQLGGLGGAGGLASAGVGDIKADGGQGRYGICLTAAIVQSGDGGDSHFGGGAMGRKTQGDGVAAANYGAGGSGGCNLSSAASQAGGNGSDGLIRVWELQ